jgi:hypothetical protein
LRGERAKRLSQALINLVAPSTGSGWSDATTILPLPSENANNGDGQARMQAMNALSATTAPPAYRRRFLILSKVKLRQKVANQGLHSIAKIVWLLRPQRVISCRQF